MCENNYKNKELSTILIYVIVIYKIITWNIECIQCDVIQAWTDNFNTVYKHLTLIIELVSTATWTKTRYEMRRLVSEQRFITNLTHIWQRDFETTSSWSSDARLNDASALNSLESFALLKKMFKMYYDIFL